MERFHLPTALVILGIPGAGKRTLSYYFEKKKYIILTMNNVLEEKAILEENQTEFSFSHNNCIGKLVDDKTVTTSFERKLGSIQKTSNIVLDGCMRTEKQAIEIIRLLKNDYHMVFVYVSCSRRTSIDRIRMRVRESLKKRIEVRSDVRNNQVITLSQDIFEENIESICNVINKLGFPVHEIDGELPKQLVIEQVKRIFSLISL